MRTSWGFMLLFADISLLLVILPLFSSLTTWEKTATFISLVIILAISTEVLYQGWAKGRAEKKRLERKLQKSKLP